MTAFSLQTVFLAILYESVFCWIMDKLCGTINTYILVFLMSGDEQSLPLVSPTECILAWKIPWTEETGGLQSLRLQRVRHKWVHTHIQRVCCINLFWFGVFWVLVNMSEGSSQYLINPWLWSIPLNCSPGTIIFQLSLLCLTVILLCAVLRNGRVTFWLTLSLRQTLRTWYEGSDFFSGSCRFSKDNRVMCIPASPSAEICILLFFPSSLSAAISYKKSVPIILFITTQALVYSSCLNTC